MKIKVTQDDIDTGERGISSHCPVALAVRRAFKLQLHDDISVTGCKVYVKGVSYFGPRSLGRFVCNFDLDRNVKPFSCEIKRKPK